MQRYCLVTEMATIGPLTQEEKESVTRIASELQDVLFEGQGMLMKLLDDYGIPPKEINQGRDARLRMERRI